MWRSVIKKKKKYVTVLAMHRTVEVPKPSTKEFSCHPSLGCICVVYSEFGNRMVAKHRAFFAVATKSNGTRKEPSALAVIAIVSVFLIYFRSATLERDREVEDAVQ